MFHLEEEREELKSIQKNIQLINYKELLEDIL